MQYRHSNIPEDPYFFALVTEGRQKIFIDDTNLETLRQAFRHLMAKRPFVIDAAIMLPEHLHCIWILPADVADFSTRWRLIKTWFTKHCDNKYKMKPNSFQLRRKEQAIWQYRYWEHLLRDAQDFEKHVH